MKVTVTGTLHRVFKKPDYKDVIGKWAIQLMIDVPLKNGDLRTDLYTITIPDDKVDLYSDKQGKFVSVECGLIGKDIVFYGM